MRRNTFSGLVARARQGRVMWALRHRESTANAAYRITQDPTIWNNPNYRDAPLTYSSDTPVPKPGVAFKTILASPSTRCIQTALQVREALGSPDPVLLFDELLERQGDLFNQRMPNEELVRRWGDQIDTQFLPNVGAFWVSEPTEHVKWRMESLRMWAEQRFPEPVLMVSHGQALRELCGVWLDHGEMRQLV